MSDYFDLIQNEKKVKEILIILFILFEKKRAFTLTKISVSSAFSAIKEKKTQIAVNDRKLTVNFIFDNSRTFTAINVNENFCVFCVFRDKRKKTLIAVNDR